jgi:hypothetical protein
MADLPTYSRMGIGYADLPRLSTADMEAGGKVWGGISEKLDRLQAFVSGKAAERAVSEAQRFAAENPITQEQIQAAKNPKGQIASFLEAFTGGGGSVYKQALAEAQGGILANDMFLESVDKFNQLRADADAGLVDYETASTEINDMIDGYSATVSAFSPEAATRMRASMATNANKVLQKVADIEAAQFEAVVVAGFNDAVPKLSRVMEDIYKFGDQFDPTTQTFVTAEDMVATQLEPMLERAVTYNKPEFIKTFTEAQRQARINGISSGALEPGFAASPADAYAKMRSGDMGKYQAMWDMMSDEDRDKAMQRVIKTVSEQKKLQTENADVRKGDLIKEAQQIQLDLYSGALGSQERKAAISRLLDINAEAETKITSNSELKAFQKGDVTENEAPEAALFVFEGQVDNGQLTSAGIQKLASEGNMSWGQARDLQNRAKAVENKRLREALKYYESQVLQNVPAYAQGQAKKDVRATQGELVDKTLSGEITDPLEEAKSLAAQSVERAKNEQKEKDRQAIMEALKRVFDGDVEQVTDNLIANPDLLDNLVEDETIRRLIRKRLDRMK